MRQILGRVVNCCCFIGAASCLFYGYLCVYHRFVMKEKWFSSRIAHGSIRRLFCSLKSLEFLPSIYFTTSSSIRGLFAKSLLAILMSTFSVLFRGAHTMLMKYENVKNSRIKEKSYTSSSRSVTFETNLKILFLCKNLSSITDVQFEKNE